jgi:hypothetical protein
MNRAKPIAPRMLRISSILLILLAATIRMAGAQVSGSVADERGAPLAGAAVELWAGERKVAVLAADAGGRFEFGAEEARGASGLLVRHPGYRAARMPIARQPAAGIVIALAVQPVALEGVTASAVRGRMCPNRESPTARALWTAAAARYSRTLDTLSVGSTFASDERTVASGREVAVVASDRLRPGSGVVLQPQTRGWMSGVERWGYGYRLRGENPFRDFGAWYYPLGDMPAHFVADAFGALHTFSSVGQDGGAMVIGFCPRDGVIEDRPRVWGMLRISLRDTLISEARYLFLTPEAVEHAGADIVYAPAVAPDGRPLPVPSTELFWRRPLGGRAFYQRYREYTRWEPRPDSAAPLRLWRSDG